jgi:argininosuccinate synthase
MEKVLLAFSGGLDTSYCAKYLSAVKKLEVYSLTVNTGGFDEEELHEIEKKAYSLGVKHHKNIDETGKFYEKCIKYLIFGNVLKNNTYPLSVSSERAIQAIAIAGYAKEIGADYIAHGSTGAGNDQVRFDMVFNIMAPEIKILTPIRDSKLTREEEIEFLKQHGVEFNSNPAKYSINKGIWGTSIGGTETLTSNLPLPDEAYNSKPVKTEAEDIILGFEKGELVSINEEVFSENINGIPKLEFGNEETPKESSTSSGKTSGKVNAIARLNEIGSEFAIGRDIHVGDTIIGIKGRVGFEAPAAMIIIKAHHALEKHVLTKWQLYWKDQLSVWYGNWIHEGQFLDPVMRNIEKFFEDSQKNVNGKVFITLYPYRFKVNGIESKNDLMANQFGSYGEMNNYWTGEDVKGFAKIFGNQLMIYNKINGL